MTMALNYTTFLTTPSPTLLHRHHHHHHLRISNQKTITSQRTIQRSLTQPRVSLSSNTHASSSSSSTSSLVLVQDSASDVIRNFYTGINGRDLSSVEHLIADNCVYEDLIFPRPFTGRKEIIDFFGKFTDTIGADLQFVIDDISNEDSSAVGVTWHLEWQGKLFPFSKGCSFYRLEVVNGKRQIIYGRDSVEPSFKPGESALVAIKGVTWLLKQFPQLADLL